MKAGNLNCYNHKGLKAKSVPTKRAPDVWDSAAFSSIFLASAFSCSQAESTPAHTQVTQAVGTLAEMMRLETAGSFYYWHDFFLFV